MICFKTTCECSNWNKKYLVSSSFVDELWNGKDVTVKEMLMKKIQCCELNFGTSPYTKYRNTLIYSLSQNLIRRTVMEWNINWQIVSSPWSCMHRTWPPPPHWRGWCRQGSRSPAWWWWSRTYPPLALLPPTGWSGNCASHGPCNLQNIKY